MNPLSPPWTITLLGSLAAVPQGQGPEQNKIITRFRTQKFGALLGYLAYYQGTVHTREFLLALIWPEMKRIDARATRRVTRRVEHLRFQNPVTTINGFRSSASALDN